MGRIGSAGCADGPLTPGRWRCQVRDTAFGVARPENQLGLHLRRHLSGRGKGAGLVLRSGNTEAMALHMEEISLAVAPGAHASFFSIKPGGMSRRSFLSQTTSPS